ncbi:MarR family transcriptional regulator [Halarcobacter ebronensis]|uniref:MarR family transcriptional regulator n=1 Tax=Halarcobacter ebronensis TaxID=1462615 RepID=A0A4Q0YGH1_9BACT|nr:MarR family transcriptional regulator [Halarcobacter ebronensis]RXJ68119.1 MarR family transcriptional regulator [Halarcobacter ebronensis]
MSFEIDNSFGLIIANIRNSIKNRIERLLLDYDLSTAQTLIIIRLCEKDNLTQKELAQNTYLKQSSLTLLIDKLEKKGLVERKNKNNDRRAYLICITKKGKELEEILTNTGKQVDEEALKDISEEAKEILIQTLKKVYLNLK